MTIRDNDTARAAPSSHQICANFLDLTVTIGIRRYQRGSSAKTLSSQVQARCRRRALFSLLRHNPVARRSSLSYRNSYRFGRGPTASGHSLLPQQLVPSTYLANSLSTDLPSSPPALRPPLLAPPQTTRKRFHPFAYPPFVIQFAGIDSC